MRGNDIILFRSQDGKAEVQLRVDGETVWLSQAEIAELFDNKPQAVTMLIKAIYEEGEQAPGATCKESLQVRQEGGRQVRRKIKLYSLPMILAVGYRVRSPRGTEFRQWATFPNRGSREARSFDGRSRGSAEARRVGWVSLGGSDELRGILRHSARTDRHISCLSNRDPSLSLSASLQLRVINVVFSATEDMWELEQNEKRLKERG